MPAVDWARCVHARCREASCERCIDACPADAISFDPTLAVDAGRCTECMLCAAACPTEALGTAGPPAATIGCRDAHRKVACLGILADEDLVADHGIELIAGRCASCRNGFVLGVLEQRIGDGVTIRRDLRGAEWSRRAFFGSMLRAPEPVPAAAPSGAKRLPERRRRLIERNLPLPVTFDVEIGPECDRCRRCVAACPTGALKNLEFDARLCVGCDVCADCCPCDAVTVTRSDACLSSA